MLLLENKFYNYLPERSLYLEFDSTYIYLVSFRTAAILVVDRRLIEADSVCHITVIKEP